MLLMAGHCVQELLVYRTWDATEHPKWLVFEVEGQLQIRPSQHEIAQHLVSHPGAIVQLNMGEGKTRVILPMLALHWAADKKHVVSVHCNRCKMFSTTSICLSMVMVCMAKSQRQWRCPALHGIYLIKLSQGLEIRFPGAASLMCVFITCRCGSTFCLHYCMRRTLTFTNT